MPKNTTPAASEPEATATTTDQPTAPVRDGEGRESGEGVEVAQPVAPAPDPALLALAASLRTWLDTQHMSEAVKVEALPGSNANACVLHVYGADVVDVRSAATILAAHEHGHTYSYTGNGLRDDGQPVAILTCEPPF